MSVAALPGRLVDLGGGVAQRRADLVHLHLVGGDLLVLLVDVLPLLQPALHDDAGAPNQALGDVLRHLPPHVAAQEQRVAVLPRVRGLVQEAGGGGDGETGDRLPLAGEAEGGGVGQFSDERDDGVSCCHGDLFSTRCGFAGYSADDEPERLRVAGQVVASLLVGRDDVDLDAGAVGAYGHVPDVAVVVAAHATVGDHLGDPLRGWLDEVAHDVTFSQSDQVLGRWYRPVVNSPNCRMICNATPVSTCSLVSPSCSLSRSASWRLSSHSSLKPGSTISATLCTTEEVP